MVWRQIVDAYILDEDGSDFIIDHETFFFWSRDTELNSFICELFSEEIRDKLDFFHEVSIEHIRALDVALDAGLLRENYCGSYDKNGRKPAMLRDFLRLSRDYISRGWVVRYSAVR